MIIGYTMLHYGTDYLYAALRSLAPYVDKHLILYSATPTFGSQTDLACPDSRDELYAIAELVLGDKLIWRDDLPQRHETVMQLLPEAELILVTDADEVWQPKLVANTLRAFRSGRLTAARYHVPMVHHWRSFGYICRDNQWPIRIALPSNQGEKEETMLWGDYIHHFGYARTLADTRYKIETSAHKHEWRPEWWDEMFTAFPKRLTDLHPVVKNLWNAEAYDLANLPDFMRAHAWYGQAVIA